ncbi:hypothetical protein [Streptomyces sp. HUAS TT3]|uniref:hypothetical protein n=1 Tax=Streptomyces sp. HUAS TT3 TaxID=3447510 RepID=UPI003F657548
MIELLPETGLFLPNGAGILRFGTDGLAAREVLARLGPVEEDREPGTGWGYSVRWCDLVVTARADAPPSDAPPLQAPPLDGPSSDSRSPDGLPLAEVIVRRGCFRPSWHGPAAVPVALDGIDLFGHPADEVREALDPHRYPGLMLPPAGPDGRLPAVTLRAGSRPDTGPDLAAYADMWTTGRDSWQLEVAGSGYTIVTKGERPMELLICHEELAEQVIARMLAAGVEIVGG